MSRVRLTIAYDGTNFRGLAPNPDVRTVVGELQPVLEAILGPLPEVHMSGRTDAGVHAREQVLTFDYDGDLDPTRLAKSINSRLGPEIVATDIRRADADFHARFSARGRSYRYMVLNHPHPWPDGAATQWWVKEPLDLATMQLACDPLIGEHDFSSFCRRPKQSEGEPPASLVRRVDSARWSDEFDESGTRRLRFEISGSAFCHQMVRSIVGFHVAVGLGKRTAGELRAVLAARDRNAAPSPAPPHGLTLWTVTY